MDDQPTPTTRVAGEDVENWDKRSGHDDPLAAVIDPSESATLKNAHIHRVHSRVLLANARFGRDDHVLDFGCGNGRMAAVAATRAGRVTGVDISPEMVRSAKQLHGGEGREFVAYDGDALPFEDATFSGFFSVGTLQLFCEDTERFREKVGDIARTLSPGADVTMVERMNPERTADEWTPQMWEEELERCGLRVERIRPVRSGATSRLTTAVYEGRVPGFLSGAAARLDIRLSGRRGVTAPYAECLVKARRV